MLCPSVQGYYCPAGSAAPLVCQPGYVCLSGTSAPAPCPAGSYCPGVSALGAALLCPSGTYGAAEVLTTAACSGPCRCVLRFGGRASRTEEGGRERTLSPAARAPCMQPGLLLRRWVDFTDGHTHDPLHVLCGGRSCARDLLVDVDP